MSFNVLAIENGEMRKGDKMQLLRDYGLFGGNSSRRSEQQRIQGTVRRRYCNNYAIQGRTLKRDCGGESKSSGQKDTDEAISINLILSIFKTIANKDFNDISWRYVCLVNVINLYKDTENNSNNITYNIWEKIIKCTFMTYKDIFKNDNDLNRFIVSVEKNFQISME